MVSVMQQAQGGASSISRRVRKLVAAALACLLSLAAHAEYRLGAGDVLEFEAVGVPDLRERVAVDIDGVAHFPLLGPLRVAGSTLAELRAKMQAELPTKVFRRRTPDGGEHPIVVAPNEINVVVAEYRPVYLNGDVSKPGEQPYRPRMTVHQAIAMAGGYEIMRFRMTNPMMDALDFRYELNALEMDYSRQSALIERLAAELGNKNDIDRGPGELQTDGAADEALIATIRKAEADQLRLRSGDYNKQLSYLRSGIDLTHKRISTLIDQASKEKEGAKADLDELSRINDLVKKGTLPFTRATEARRMALLSSTSLLQTQAMLGQTSLQGQDLQRQVEKLPDARRLDLVRDLESAQVELAKLRARMATVKRKLAYAGILRSQLSSSSGNGFRPKLTIFRDSQGKRERMKAEEYTELEPGDLVEVVIWDDLAASAENAASPASPD
jgi:polysaccharide export outer membrane protein